MVSGHAVSLFANAHMVITEEHAGPEQQRASLTGPDTRPAAPAWLPPLALSAVYLAISLFAYHQTVFSGNARLTSCACGDQIQEAWFLRWDLFALEHGHNPLFSAWMNAPRGVNLAVNTSFPFLGILFAPFTLLLGAIATYNILLAFAMAASAIAMFLALRRWVRSWLACFLGGLLYEISPFMVGQGIGHLFLVAIFVPPIVLVLLDEILVRQRHGVVRDGLLLGATLAIQYYISPEVLVMTIILAACGIVLLALANWVHIREHAIHIIKSFLWCGGLSVALLCYPLWMAIAGPSHVIGLPHSIAFYDAYPGDLQGFIVPTSKEILAPAAWKLHGDALSGKNASENSLYLGVPLIMVLALLLWLGRRSRALWFFFLMALISGILALGPRLTINRDVTGIRLPFTVLRHIPLFQDILPIRFSLFLQMFAAMSLALGLELFAGRLRASGRRTGRGRLVVAIPGALAVFAALPLLPNIPFVEKPVAIPGFYTSSAVNRIPSGSVVLAYPNPDRPSQEQAMLGQIASGMRFRIVSGVAIGPGPGGRSISPLPNLMPTVVQSIFTESFSPGFGPGADVTTFPVLKTSVIRALRNFLFRYEISAVVVQPVGNNPAGVVRYVSAVLGPGENIDGVVAWFRVRHRLQAKRL
jgi:hypothetical protein